MKQKNWTQEQIKEALSLKKEVNSSFKGISISSKIIKKKQSFFTLKRKKL